MASNEYDTVTEVHELKAGNLQRKNELDEGGRRVCGCCLDCLLTVLNILTTMLRQLHAPGRCITLCSQDLA